MQPTIESIHNRSFKKDGLHKSSDAMLAPFCHSASLKNHLIQSAILSNIQWNMKAKVSYTQPGTCIAWMITKPEIEANNITHNWNMKVTCKLNGLPMNSLVFKQRLTLTDLTRQAAKSLSQSQMTLF